MSEDHVKAVLQIIDTALAEVNKGADLFSLDRINDLLLDVRNELALYEQIDLMEEKLRRVRKWI